MTPGLGSSTFQKRCIYRGRANDEERRLLGRQVLWVCTIEPGKPCSACICPLESYPFETPNRSRPGDD